MPTLEPAPERHQVLTFVSPSVADILFYERRDSRKPENQSFEYGQRHWNSIKYPDHVLVYVTASDETGWQRWFYAAERENQDAYNFEYSSASLDSAKFETVLRTYVSLRSDYVANTPAIGTAMPLVPAATFANYSAGDFVLFRTEARRIGDKELDSIFVVEQREYLKRVTITRLDFDEDYGCVLPVTQALYYRGEVVTGEWTVQALFADGDNVSGWWGVQDTGIAREGLQLSADWYAITTRALICGAPTDGGIIELRDYLDTHDFSWPAVLREVEIMDWVLKDGGTRNYPRPVYSKHSYSGPCRLRVQEWWSASEHPTLDTMQAMNPLPLNYNCPFYGISIGPTLHTAAAFWADTGTNDPTWGYNVNSRRVFEATNYTDWPALLVVADGQSPFRGGWLRRKLTIYRPVL